MSSVVTATMTDVSDSNTSSMAKYYASKIGELSEVSLEFVMPMDDDRLCLAGCRVLTCLSIYFA